MIRKRKNIKTFIYFENSLHSASFAIRNVLFGRVLNEAYFMSAQIVLNIKSKIWQKMKRQALYLIAREKKETNKL